MLIAHGPIATLTSAFVVKDEFKKLKIVEKVLFILFTLLLGILPDFDIFYLVARGQSALMHHHLITHTPIFWILLGLILYLLMKIFHFPKSKRLKRMFFLTFLISSLSHLFFDLFTGHIMLFYPFSKHFYTIFGNLVADNLFSGYIGNPIFGLEVLILFVFLFFLGNTFLKLKLLFFPILAGVYLLFNIFIYTQTYQVELYKRDGDGFPAYDTDRDGLANPYDLDFDNNFIDNYKQVSKEELLLQFEKIPQNYLPSMNRNIYEGLKYYYGGNTMLRAVLQAYAQTDNYLTPVVHNYMKQNGVDRFSDGLYQFLHSTNDFKQIDGSNQLIPGALVMRKDGFNALGIVLSDGRILIEDMNGKPTYYSSTDDLNNFLIQK